MSEKIHFYKHRVRYADTDKMGVVYHARYFEWFEAARTEMLRDTGFPYRKIEESGVLLPVIEANCKYFQPVEYDELITVKTTLQSFTKAKLWLSYEVSLDKSNIPKAEGYTIHCFMDQNGKAVRATSELVEFFKSLH
ncbi:MAG: thioesterase family protein [bacterium]